MPLIFGLRSEHCLCQLRKPPSNANERPRLYLSPPLYPPKSEPYNSSSYRGLCVLQILPLSPVHVPRNLEWRYHSCLYGLFRHPLICHPDFGGWETFQGMVHKHDCGVAAVCKAVQWQCGFSDSLSLHLELSTTCLLTASTHTLYCK